MSGVEILPPIEISEGILEIVSIGINYDKNIVTIGRHTEPKNKPIGF